MRVKRMMMGGALAAMLVGATTGMAAEATVSLDVASAYVFRGSTFNDGLVLQPGMEVAGLPITLGVWGNFDIDDYDGAVTENEFSEVDIYGSYSLPIDAADLSIGYTEYIYPAGGEADREVSLSAGLDVALAPSVGVFYGFDGAIEKSIYVEAGVGHEFAVSEDVAVELGVTVGYMDPDAGKSGFSHYTASVGSGYGCLSASVTYIGQIDDDVLMDVADGGSYDTEIVGVLSVGHDF